jgi:hypothetical protein
VSSPTASGIPFQVSPIRLIHEYVDCFAAITGNPLRHGLYLSGMGCIAVRLPRYRAGPLSIKKGTAESVPRTSPKVS